MKKKSPGHGCQIILFHIHLLYTFRLNVVRIYKMQCCYLLWNENIRIYLTKCWRMLKLHYVAAAEWWLEESLDGSSSLIDNCTFLILSVHIVHTVHIRANTAEKIICNWRINIRNTGGVLNFYSSSSKQPYGQATASPGNQFAPLREPTPG